LRTFEDAIRLHQYADAPDGLPAKTVWDGVALRENRRVNLDGLTVSIQNLEPGDRKSVV